jgi:DNA-binding response OmpR family regulator
VPPCDIVVNAATSVADVVVDVVDVVVDLGVVVDVVVDARLVVDVVVVDVVVVVVVVLEVADRGDGVEVGAVVEVATGAVAAAAAGVGVVIAAIDGGAVVIGVIGSDGLAGLEGFEGAAGFGVPETLWGPGRVDEVGVAVTHSTKVVDVVPARVPEPIATDRAMTDEGGPDGAAGRTAAAGGSTTRMAVRTTVPTANAAPAVTRTQSTAETERRTPDTFPSSRSVERSTMESPEIGYSLAVALVTLVEDDVPIQQALTRALEARGHVVQAHGSPQTAITEITSDPPDVVILDLGLPDIDGLDVLRMVRAVRDVPVIVASARDDDGDIVTALDLGADDYVVKPFSADQLDARIRALIRRTRSGERSAKEAVTIGELTIDPAMRQVTLAGNPVELNRKEFDVLAYLASRRGEIVSKRDLWRDVWHQPYRGTDKTIDVHLSWLRRKLGESSTEPRYLRTVRGVGVRLARPDT